MLFTSTVSAGPALDRGVAIFSARRRVHQAGSTFGSGRPMNLGVDVYQNAQPPWVRLAGRHEIAPALYRYRTGRHDGLGMSPYPRQAAERAGIDHEIDAAALTVKVEPAVPWRVPEDYLRWL
jgi:hypothetical protein